MNFLKNNQSYISTRDLVSWFHLALQRFLIRLYVAHTTIVGYSCMHNRHFARFPESFPYHHCLPPICHLFAYSLCCCHQLLAHSQSRISLGVHPFLLWLLLVVLMLFVAKAVHYGALPPLSPPLLENTLSLQTHFVDKHTV